MEQLKNTMGPQSQNKNHKFIKKKLSQSIDVLQLIQKSGIFYIYIIHTTLVQHGTQINANINFKNAKIDNTILFQTPSSLMPSCNCIPPCANIHPYKAHCPNLVYTLV
jgi:hypothetical protein